MKNSAILRVFALITIVTGSAVAQGPSADATCAQKLNAPTADTMVLQLTIRVANLDTSHHIPPHRAEMIGEGIRQFVAMPRTLEMDVYGTGKESFQWIVGVYRVSLHRNGHLTSARAVGGTRTKGLDTAVIASLVALDTSGLITPPDSATMGSADSLDLRIVIAPTFVSSTKAPQAVGDALAAKPTGYVPREGVTPFVRLRVPVRRSTEVVPKSGNPVPVYPRELRNAGIEGEAVLTFVIGPDGVPDVSSVQIGRLTALQFASAALEVLPKMRFEPKKVEGCPVSAYATMPFTFNLNRPD